MTPDPAAPLDYRDPAVVMRLARMGSFHQHRLSFMRILLRRMKAERWRFERRRFDIDARGVGVAVYTMHGPERAYSLVAFAHDLPPEMRSDRVIATAWDATFTIFDGVPEAADIERLRANVPLQEAGRVSARELSVSRANRSVRLWDHVVERLSKGAQPDAEMVEGVGYLMRTTAVYGSGKLGAADREDIAARPECAAPFQIEMLSVWLTRTFVVDLVEHMARVRGGAAAVALSGGIRRALGIGNSTGLGMAPFLINHPVLLNNWIMAREAAFATVRALPTASAAEAAKFVDLVRRAQVLVAAWRSDHPAQAIKIASLTADLTALARHLITADLSRDNPWQRLWDWAEGALGLEGQEMLVSLMMEPYGALVDGFADCMAADEAAAQRIDGTMTVGALRDLIARQYGWALGVDWSAPRADARVWYVSAEKLEPRLAERHEEDLADYEQALQPGRDIARLDAAIAEMDDDAPIAGFLVAHPDHRHSVRRVQIAARYPYAEIRDNTIDAEMLPIDLLRAKLAFFGAQHFDPRSDRWVRINMFRGAPYPQDLGGCDADDWAYPQ